MIKLISHQAAGTGPADLTLALSVAHALHTPTSAPRAPEVPPVPQLMGLRTSADRHHRRRVPLHRLTTIRDLTTLGA